MVVFIYVIRYRKGLGNAKSQREYIHVPRGEMYENNSVTRPFYPTPTSQLVRYTHTLTVPNPLLLYGPGSEGVKQNQTPLSFTAKEAAILASDQLPWCHT